MAMTKKIGKNDNIINNDIEHLVPKDHFVRKLEKAIDLSFIEEQVAKLYSPYGRPSVPPIILFKMLIINYIFGINSMRKTCEECKTNIAYKWYLGVSMEEKIPNYSTWSQNYRRRYKNSTIFYEIFLRILFQTYDYGFIDATTIFGDGTHEKANANKNKSINKEIEIEPKVYENELLKAINEYRIKNRKKPFERLIREETIFNEETGKEEKVTGKKNIKVSVNDPESGCFHKGEKQKCFAYEHQTFCDKNGFVISVATVPGNIHDSVSFYDAYNEAMSLFKGETKNISLDAGYFNPAICKTIIDDGMKGYMPYKRPMTKKGFFKKREFEYIEDANCYICPNNTVLKYVTTDRQGYHSYKSEPKKCKNCPLRQKCTKSKNHQKIVTRHIWENYKEQVEETRHTKEWKEIYPLRKQTIERVFAISKEQHGLRFTRLNGLLKNFQEALLIFACYNLKKMALWIAK